MTLPNKITITRLILLPFFIWAVVSYFPGQQNLRYIALSIFIIACLTDFMDGYLARRFKQRTDLGRILDASVDKTFIILSFFTLSLFSNYPEAVQLPIWVVWTVIGRDVAVVMGTIFIYLKFKELYIFPAMLGKISIVFEMGTIISILLLFKYSYIIWNLTVIFVMASGIVYLIRTLKEFSKRERT
jgi:cardiolipin synthase